MRTDASVTTAVITLFLAVGLALSCSAMYTDSGSHVDVKWYDEVSSYEPGNCEAHTLHLYLGTDRPGLDKESLEVVYRVSHGGRDDVRTAKTVIRLDADESRCGLFADLELMFGYGCTVSVESVKIMDRADYDVRLENIEFA